MTSRASTRYVKTRSGWLYLAAVLDLYSRRVVGWAMSRRMTRKLAIQALQMALVQRGQLQKLLHHSDRGSQYASKDYHRQRRHSTLGYQTPAEFEELTLAA